MTATLILATVMVAAPVGYLTLTLLSGHRGTRAAVRRNLGRGLDQEVAVGNGITIAERVGRRITPAPYIRRLDKLLSLAGRPASLPLGRLLAAKPIAGVTGALFGVLIATAGGPLMTLTALVVTIGGYFLPDLLLLSRGQKRQQAIQLELANTLDQMLISVEAGLGFEAAMSRAGETGRGPLAEELVRTLQDMQVGRSRRESYLALAERTSLPELRSFVQAVIQADTYGIAIGKVLRVQAKAMRLKRRQRAEEKAMKLPVMILFPLLFFIFPVLFIAILGPAVINAVITLG